MYKNKIIRPFLGILILTVVCFNIVGGCGGDNTREVNPDEPTPPANEPPPPPVNPTPPQAGTGEIRGTVVSSSGGPLNGVHVRAVDINNTNVQISSFSGIDSNLVFVDGAFSIQNVPAGSYRILIERLDNRNSVFNSGIYSTFITLEATSLSFPDEYYNGTDESDSDVTSEFVVVTVSDGSTTNGINFITND